jgi:hypothetical protein
MPTYWNINDNSLTLPEWVRAKNTANYSTYMAQIVMFLRSDGLTKLHAMIAKSEDQKFWVPCDATPKGANWHIMQITNNIDILPKSDGWFKVSFDAIFDS